MSSGVTVFWNNSPMTGLTQPLKMLFIIIDYLITIDRGGLKVTKY